MGQRPGSQFRYRKGRSPEGRRRPFAQKKEKLMENVDWSFISKEEGTRTKGYVLDPSRKEFQNSGATIATGFDIGKHNEDELHKMFGRGSDLYDLFLPYVGLTGAAAAAKLKEMQEKGKPLDLGNIKASYVDDLVKRYKYGQMAGAWANLTSEIRFDELPREYATAVMSVAFQHGVNGAPKFFGHAARGDWSAAEAELRDFYGFYKSEEDKSKGGFSNRPVDPTKKRKVSEQLKMHPLQPRMTRTANLVAQRTKKQIEKYPHLYETSSVEISTTPPHREQSQDKLGFTI